MRTTIETPSSINHETLDSINQLACLGFGQTDPAAMLTDTAHHIESADFVQQAYIDQQRVGFALYKRCLWRKSN